MKVAKYLRLQREMEADLEEFEEELPEIGADLRWSLITLARAIVGMERERK